ncbi:hypothetical protein IID24_02895 [Patescibacteria group bacterium]|nr:hypothetical protein [Patescibacteria group bacterium]
MKKLTIIFIGWFVIVNIFALFALNRLNLAPDTAYTWMNPEETLQTQRWGIVSLHSQWDSFWYLDIAENGYSYKGEGQLANIVFFPLYPFLINIVASLVGGDLGLAGWTVSSVFLFLALLYLYKLVREYHSDINPYLPVLFLLIFPTAFFLNAVYTESLFLFLSLASFYYALQGRFFLAGIFGMFASITRATGVLLFIPLAWEYWRQHELQVGAFLRAKFLPLLMIPLGTIGFFLFHYLKFGDVFLFLRVESSWGRAFSFNKDHFTFLTNPAVSNFALDLFFVSFFIVAIIFAFLKLRTSYGLYMISTFLVVVSTGTLMSIGRYILVLFPIYILAASIKNEYFRQAWILISILLLAANITLFVNNYWAG